MPLAELQEESLRKEIEKKGLEIQALRRSSTLDRWKFVLTVIGAFAFLFAFGFDRYKVYEQRRWDRQVVIVAELDRLLSRTLAALHQPRVDTLFLRLNLEAYRSQLVDLEKRLSGAESTLRSKELLTFLADSKALSDSLLANVPVKYEFYQWAEGIDLIAIWEGKAVSLAPDFGVLFGADLESQWTPLRERAINAMNNKFSLLDSSSSALVEEFRKSASNFQRAVHTRLR
jgi:hypothetical protein